MKKLFIFIVCIVVLGLFTIEKGYTFDVETCSTLIASFDACFYAGMLTDKSCDRVGTSFGSGIKSYKGAQLCYQLCKLGRKSKYDGSYVHVYLEEYVPEFMKECLKDW